MLREFRIHFTRVQEDVEWIDALNATEALLELYRRFPDVELIQEVVDNGEVPE